MRLYLIGYMASGKSKVGRDLAGKLGFEFVDMDDMFEERYRISIYDFFIKYDECHFRKIEREILHETGNFRQTVISTGGGTPCYFDNMDFINSTGRSVYLRWEIPALVDRLHKVRKKRPLLREITEKNLLSFVTGHLAEREVYYLQAGFTFDAENGTLDQIVSWLSSCNITD